VKRALVHIEARCTHDRVSGTGFVVDVSRYGLTRDALVMTAWHVIQPSGCSGQKVDVTVSGPGVGELTLSDVLGSHLVFPKEDPRKLGLDVALLQVNAKEGATALPLDELPLTAGHDLVTIWGYPASHGQARGPDAEVTYRKGPVVPGPTHDGHATLTTDALLRTDQGMSGGPAVLQGHGSVVALVNRRDLLPIGTAELPYVLTPMSVVRDLLPAHLRQRLHLLPRQAEDFALPAIPTAYVHRPDKEAAVKQALTTRASGPGVQKAPFVVVHGMPGVGKSTLAKAVAQQLAADLRWQVLYRDVAQRTPDGFVVELLQALTGERPRVSAKPSMDIALTGAPERGITMEDLATQLHAELRNRPRLLLLLDDVTWTQLPAWLLRAMEDTPVLLTSRQSFPEGTPITLNILTDSQCQELYQRLRGESQASVPPKVAANVCTQLGRHPTALTLAAGVLKRKLGTWTDEDLLTHLAQKRLDVLNQGTSDPTRTIPALCEESLRTLPDSQRTAAMLAVVVLGQLADAAVPRSLLTALLSRPGLLGGRPDSAESAEAAIDQLVEAGLLSPDGPSEQKLLRMHTLVWEWAGKLPQKAEHKEIPQKVRDALLAILNNWQGGQVLREALLAHLLNAQEEAAKARQWSRVIEYGTMFQEELILYGHWGYLKQLLQNSLSAAEFNHDLAAQGKIKKALGLIAESQGDHAEARKRYQDALDLAQSLGDRRGISSNLNNLGNVAREQGDYDTAHKYYQQSLDLAKALGDRQGIANIMLNLGNVAGSQGDYEAARKYYQQSLELAQALGDRQGISSSLGNLGNLAQTRGDIEAARKYYQQSLDLAQASGDRQGIANIMLNLGNVARLQGDHEAARKYYQQSLDLAQALGDRYTIGRVLWGQSWVATKLGKKAEARTLLDQAIQIFKDLRDQALVEAQKARDALGPPPDPTKCRTTCQDLQAKVELRTFIYECAKVLCTD
jgi:tetratricopeptide (TPR) repeat protein